jgi:hypothetical protein
MTTKPALQKILKRILHTEMEDKCNQENKKVNLTRQVDKQMKIRRVSNITKTTKMTRITAYISILILHNNFNSPTR